jgi:hypothetical protein
MIKISKKIVVLIFLNFTLQPLFQSTQHFMRKGKDPEPERESDPYLSLTDPDADPGGQKHTDPTDPDPEHCRYMSAFWFLCAQILVFY